MCAVSMIGDHYRDTWKDKWPGIDQWPPFNPAPAVPLPGTLPGTTTYPVVWTQITREEFDELKKEVLNLKQLLIKAKIYDEENGEPECEMDEKIALIKKVAEAVGVDLSEVFGK